MAVKSSGRHEVAGRRGCGMIPPSIVVAAPNPERCRGRTHRQTRDLPHFRQRAGRRRPAVRLHDHRQIEPLRLHDLRCTRRRRHPRPQRLKAGRQRLRRRCIVDDYRVLAVAIVRRRRPIERVADHGRGAALGVYDHQLVVHLSRRVLDLDGNARRTERLIIRRRIARPERIPQPPDHDAALVGGDQRIAQRILGEKEDSEVDARLRRFDLDDHFRHRPILRRKVDFDGNAVVRDGGRHRRRLLAAKGPGRHLVEVVLIQGRQVGAGEDEAVVVIEREVVVGEVGAARPGSGTCRA